MEERVFAPRSQVSAEQIYLFKREVLELRRAVMPLANPLRRLAEGYTPLIPEQVRSYFRDVDDHLTEVSERVTAFDELLTTLVDATLAKITLQQNTDMRKITSWVAIISVPTMVVGVYGMNFDYMPELKWKFGYPLVMSSGPHRLPDALPNTAPKSLALVPISLAVVRRECPAMTRILTNIRFWILAFLLCWITTVFVLICGTP